MPLKLDDEMRKICARNETWSRSESFEGEYIASTVSVGGGINLAYSEWNPGATETLVMLHGLNVQRHTWDPIASVLSRRFRVLTVDLRGHGESSWSTEGYWVRDMAVDIATFLDKLSVQKCVLVGHSLGAQVAIVVAANVSIRIAGLVLSDTSPTIPSNGRSAISERAGARLLTRGFNTMDEVKALFDQDHPEWKPVFRVLHARHQVRRNWAGKLVYRADTELFWLYGSAGLRDEALLWRCAADVKAPTQLMWGARSAHVDSQVIDRMRRTVKHFQDTRFETGHFIPREAPSEFVDKLLDFIAGCTDSEEQL